MELIEATSLWRQFGAAIDTLEDALRACPPYLWQAQLWPDRPNQGMPQGFSTFWYLGYHSLFWLDLYLSGTEEGFAPPATFDLIEMKDGESLPRVYTQDELLGYAQHCRQACQQTILSMTSAQARRMCHFGWGSVPYAELMLYTMRHMQEHAAQLHMFLGQQSDQPTNWRPKARPDHN